MNNKISNIFETIGINLLRLANRKQTDPNLFNYHNYTHEDIRSIYINETIFKKCDSYNNPIVIKEKNKNKLNISLNSMESMYKPIKQFETNYNKLIENKTIYFEKVSSDINNKNCLIFLHGFSERSYGKEINLIFKKIITKINDLDIIAVHLPYHMDRSPSIQPYSGAYLFDSHPIVTIEGLRQGVHDVSQVISYAKDKYNKVIVGGTSLGGHITAYLGTCDDRADLYIMGQTGVNLPITLLNLPICPGLSKKRKEWIKNGLAFIQSLSTMEILNYKSVIPSEKVVSIGGVYDKIITFDKVQKLRNFFEPKYILDYPSGHIGFLLIGNKTLNKLIDIIKQNI